MREARRGDSKRVFSLPPLSDRWEGNNYVRRAVAARCFAWCAKSERIGRCGSGGRYILAWVRVVDREAVSTWWRRGDGWGELRRKVNWQLRTTTDGKLEGTARSDGGWTAAMLWDQPYRRGAQRWWAWCGGDCSLTGRDYFARVCLHRSWLVPCRMLRESGSNAATSVSAAPACCA